MEFTPTRIADVVVVTPRVFGDERGFFLESWERQKFAQGGIDIDFVQDNHSHSVKGTLRGLHYQLNQSQGKLVRVTKGEVFDVAVDLRRRSPTFGQWVGVTLSSNNFKMLWVPPGFAHGFFVVSDTAEFQYKCSDYYAPNDEHCIHWADPTLAIDWPLGDTVQPLVSDKDELGKLFKDAEVYP
ncbi:MAG: dTDP-4-dehydrorhamnose 3,5-epimerase [Pseudomonadota bacterium]